MARSGAAVDGEHLPGQVAGRGGQHERGDLPELVGLPVAAQRDRGRQPGPHLVRVAAARVQPPDPAGGDPAGQQPVHPDPARAQFVGQGLGHPGQARPQAVGDGQRGDRRPDRRGQHERDRAALAQLGAGQPGQPHRAQEHALERGPPGVVRDRPAVPPPGGPPTLISTPSRRPKASRDAASSRAAASGSALSAVIPTAWPGPPRPAAASATAAASRALSTTFAPSAASAWAVASPRPRLPPVIRYTRSRRPRSIAAILPHAVQVP